jgi:hypothetical protein
MLVPRPVQVVPFDEYAILFVTLPTPTHKLPATKVVPVIILLVLIDALPKEVALDVLK